MVLVIMKKIVYLLGLLLLTGCATPDYITYGYQINKVCLPKSCLQQAYLYVDFIDGKVYSNKTHAFVIKNNRIYDSTNMAYTGISINNWRIKELYGEKESWKLWK